MKEERHHEESLFNEACQLPSPESRAAFLAGACGEDAALRQRLDARLEAAEKAGDATPQPPVSAEAPSSRRLGDYELLNKLGEGGWGWFTKPSNSAWSDSLHLR